MENFQRCNNCSVIYDLPQDSSETISCPSCGTPLDLSITVEENLEVHEWIQKRDRLAGSRRPISEQRCGDELSSTGEWVYLQRIIDRKNNWYTEIVINKETDEVIRYCEEPLDRHTGHGSDKKN